MTVPNVGVRFSADDQATEVARKLLELLRQLDREQKQTASTTSQLAAPAKAAADGFERMRQAIIGFRSGTSGLDAVSKRVALLSQGLKSASTRAASLAELRAAEALLQKELKAGNLTLEQRIQLERQLATTQQAIKGGAGPDVPEGALGRFQQLHSLLLSIAATIGAIRLLGFAKGVIDAADAMNDLSQTTGVSVESLSVFQTVAEKNGATVESLQVGFRKLAQSVEALRAGNQEAAATFAAIGLGAEDLKGLSLDQVFLKIADAQEQFANGSGKITVATRLFGRSGEELLQTLHELANGGFDRAAEEANALGGTLTTEGARGADAFNDSLVDLRKSVAGFGNQLATVLGPLTRFIDGVAAFLGRIPAGVKTFVAVGAVVAAAATALVTAVGGIVLAFGLLATAVGGGVVAGIIAAIVGIATAAAALAAKFRSAREEKDKLLGSSNPVVSLEFIDNRTGKVTSATKPDVTITDPAQLKAARQAQLTAASQHARDLLAIQQAGLKQQQQAEDDAFAANLVGFGQHFNKRIEIARAGTAAEVASINSELARLQNAPLPENTQAARIQRETEINALVAQRRRVEIEGETTVNSLLAQQEATRKAAVIELTTLQAQLFRQQGQDLKAAQIEIAQAADKFAQTLTRQGFGAEIVAELRTTFSTLQTDIAAFQAQQKVAQHEVTQLSLDRAAVEQKVATGVLSQREGELAILEIERQRKPALQQAADLMKAFAERVGDPALLQAAQQLQSTIDGMGKSVLQSTLLIANFKSNLLSAGQSELSNFLGSTINQVHSLGDAFRQLGAAIAASFQRVSAELIATKVFEKIASLFGLGVNSGAAALAKAGVEVQKGGASVLLAAAALAGAAKLLQVTQGASIAFGGILQSGVGLAAGGQVKGPGTGTSDSIPARLSAGEFVQPAHVTRHYGVAFMEALRAMRVPKAALATSVAGRPAVMTHPVQVIVPVLVVRDHVERDTLLRREQQLERPPRAAQLDPLGVGTGRRVHRVGGIEERLFSTLHRAHDVGRDFVQQLRERTETIHLARQQHQLPDGSGATDQATQERRVSRTDREFLRVSHVARVVESVRQLFRREQRSEITGGRIEKRLAETTERFTHLGSQLTQRIHVGARDLLERVRERPETRRGDGVPLGVKQHAILGARFMLRSDLAEQRNISRESSHRVSHEETRLLGVVQYTVRRALETLSRDVLEFARVMALATSVAGSGKVPAFASGGYVRGPGTATSDSIPARLSAGEYVQTARATAYYGVPIMEAIRTLRIPRELLLNFAAGLHTPPIRSVESVGVPNVQRFAEGGLVTAVAPTAAATTPLTVSRDDTLTIAVRHSDEAIVEFVHSTRGVRALTEMMSRHKGQIKAALT